jgi:hypothetical protein
LGGTDVDEPGVWSVRGGEHGDSEEASLRDGHVAIGWGELPDLSTTVSKEDVGTLMRQVYPDRSPRRIGAQKVSVYDFAHSIGTGDIVLLPLKTRPGEVAVGRVAGDYEYHGERPRHSRHVRDVEWLAVDVEVDRFEHLKRWINLPRTVVRIPVSGSAITEMLETGGRLEAARDAADELPALLEAAMQELAGDETPGERLRELVTDEGPSAVEAAAGGGWTVKGSVGIGTVAEVPWIGIYPEGSTASAQSGFYAVYLFAADGSAVYLSLNQGTEQVRSGTRPIQKRALDLRTAARIPEDAGREIDLHSNASRPKKYEAGNAYAIQYAADEVPTAETLKDGLASVLAYLQTAIESGLSFDPEIEPTHFVLKWSADIEAQTVALHEAKAKQKGSVWWGRFRQSGAPDQLVEARAVAGTTASRHADLRLPLWRLRDHSRIRSADHRGCGRS